MNFFEIDDICLKKNPLKQRILLPRKLTISTSQQTFSDKHFNSKLCFQIFSHSVSSKFQTEEYVFEVK